jgi:hypothetical protein
MCMRLYLNGDGDVRGSHVSLFLVLQCGDYDAILHWPFSFNTTLCLIDQLQLDNNQHDIVKSFWPDKNLYIQDDTMFIKIKVDFLTERPSK